MTLKEAVIIFNFTPEKFIQRFKDMNRDNQFTEEGLKVIYNHIVDNDYEMIINDPIAVCCTFSEVEIDELSHHFHDYDVDPFEYSSVEEYHKGILDYIHTITNFAYITGCNTIVYAEY